MPLLGHRSAGCGRRGAPASFQPRARVAARRIGALAGALAVALLPVAEWAGAQAGGKLTREYDLKAAFLFNFVQFVEWPAEAFPDAETPITIGILGDDPFGNSLAEIVANEAVRHRKLLIRHYRTIEQVGDCHILFISSSEVGRLDHAVARLDRRSILTVGDTKDFARRLGVIGFVIAQNRLRLQINLAAAGAAGLTISSKLLRQAEIVGASEAP